MSDLRVVASPCDQHAGDRSDTHGSAATSARTATPVQERRWLHPAWIAPEGMGQTSTEIAEKLGQSFASPQKLLELSRGLQVREGSIVRNAKNLSTGEVQIQFDTTHTDENGAPLKVPGLFLLAIPVFEAGQPYEIAVRLRYRLSQGRITWFYEMHSVDVVLRDAIEEAATAVEKETALPVFRGSPE